MLVQTRRAFYSIYQLNQGSEWVILLAEDERNDKGGNYTIK
jgi:hypothetical protein